MCFNLPTCWQLGQGWCSSLPALWILELQLQTHVHLLSPTAAAHLRSGPVLLSLWSRLEGHWEEEEGEKWHHLATFWSKAWVDVLWPVQLSKFYIFISLLYLALLSLASQIGHFSKRLLWRKENDRWKYVVYPGGPVSMKRPISRSSESPLCPLRVHMCKLLSSSKVTSST